MAARRIRARGHFASLRSGALAIWCVLEVNARYGYARTRDVAVDKTLNNRDDDVGLDGASRDGSRSR